MPAAPRAVPHSLHDTPNLPKNQSPGPAARSAHCGRRDRLKSPTQTHDNTHEKHVSAISTHFRRALLAHAAQPNGKPLMKMAELTQRSGLTRQMIASYCMYGLLHETLRTPKGHRLFDEKALTRLKIIRDLLKHGYTLRDIREIFLKGKR